MPLIPKRTTRTKVVRHITQLYQENNEELYAYAQVHRGADRVCAECAHRASAEGR